MIALGGTTCSKDNQSARRQNGEDPMVNHLFLLEGLLLEDGESAATSISGSFRSYSTRFDFPRLFDGFHI